MITTLKAKPTMMTVEEMFYCNNDKPTNAECLADHIAHLEWMLANPEQAKEYCPWKPLDKQLDFIADQIISLVA